MIWIKIIGSGVVAALVMTLFLWIVTRMPLPQANMLELIGVYSRKKSNQIEARRLGWLLHLAAGGFFALLYYFLIALYNPNSAAPVILLSVGISTFHGLAVTFFTLIVPVRYNPVYGFRQINRIWGLVYIAGHIIYGGTLGILLSLLVDFPPALVS